MSLTDEMRNRVSKYWDKRGRLNLWAGAITNQSLQGHVSRQAKNQEAEDSYVRRKAWEDQSTAGGGAVDDMGHTILGDVTNPTPIVIHSQPQQQGSGLGKVLAGAALMAGLIGIPGAAVGGYLLNQFMNQKPPAVQPTKPSEDNTVDLGLLHWDQLQGKK